MEDLLGEQVVVIERVEHAGHRCHGRADGDSQHFPAEGVDAQCLRRFFIFPNRLPVITGAALEQPGAERERAGCQRKNRVVVHRRRAAKIGDVDGVALRDFEEQATGATEPLQVVKADAGELAKRNRQQREVHARDAEAEREKTNDAAKRHAQGNGEPHAGPGADAEMHEQARRRIRTNANVKRMPERELAAKTHHHVPCLAREGEKQNQGGD